MEIKAVFFNTRKCQVEKAVMLTAEQFDRFSEDMLAYYPFIGRNSDIGVETQDGKIRCFLVVGQDRKEGVLVNTEGVPYARYTAFLPDARKAFEGRLSEGLELEMGSAEASEGIEMAF